MSNRNKVKYDMKAVAENCSQFSPIAAMQASVNEAPVRTCEVCKKWDGRRCSIGLYDVISENRDIR